MLKHSRVCMIAVSAALLIVQRTYADVVPVSPDSKVVASFPTNANQGVENLIDGDPKTVMIGAANSAPEGKPVWVDLKFPKAVANLAGVELGDSDPFGNYFPIEMEFWVDTDNNGTFDTRAGATKDLGPGAKSAGVKKFDGRLEDAYGVRVLVTKQNVQGLRRCFSLSEIKLVTNASVPVIAPTPDQKPPVAEAPAKPEAPVEAGPAMPKTVAADASIVPNSDALPGKIFPLPAGTKVSSSFGMDKGRGAEILFDNDLSVLTNSVGGIVRERGATTSIFIRFPEPVANLGGIETGSSDTFKNYYPVEFEFWADSDGDGRFDTLLGRTRKLGGANDSIGRHAFDARLEKNYGLEIRCVEQNVGGGGRAWSMNEMRLLTNDQLPLATPTPNSYRVLNFNGDLPEGTTVSSNIQCEPGKGPEMLIDHDPTTFMNPSPGSAQAGRASSVFLKFPKPVTGLTGIRLGGGDPFRNYIWQEMEIRVDTKGDGTYDTLAATISGGGAGSFKFRQAVAQAFGIELRVTKQKIGGTNRAFMLNDIPGLILRDEAGDTPMSVVVEDFEDFSSWRTWATNTNQPDGERYYGGYTYLSGALRPELAKNGQGVGLMRYCFKPGFKDYLLYATRGRVNRREGIIDSITFWANPQNYPCAISFEVFDAKGKKIRTPGLKIEGNDWKQYTVDLSATAVPAMAQAQYPLRLQHIFMSSAQAGEGDILLDDIALHGVFDRGQRLRIAPVFEGIAYDPAKPLTPKYELTNALGSSVDATLVASLYSSFDTKRLNPLVSKDVAVSMPAYGRTNVTLDFGVLPEGHYQVDLSVDTPQIAVRTTDQLALVKLNGGRVNKSPMWFGATHPAGWIAQVENDFVMKHVVLPLGIDAYRTGAPDKYVIDSGLLMAAGFGEVPPALRQPKEKNDSRGEPTDYDKYYEWCKEQAREKFLPYKDRILSIEFYNEPDLPGFGYLPEIDTYLKMHAVFAKAFREAAPGIAIGTGGNTVQHGKEKKDFNPRMYTELANQADVAIFHAHGALENFVGRQKMVEQWMEKGGRPRDKQVIGNTEAGLPSGDSPTGQMVQADCLVKKIGWAKEQHNSLYYIWFTTTDTYDPQGGYLDNENWGLITYNQRLKPSGQAYNEIIRQLSNTRGTGEVSFDDRIQTCAFDRDDGTQVWLNWPRERGASFLARFASSGPVTLTDMFGTSQTLTPVRGVVSMHTNGYPFYIEAPKGATFGRAEKPSFVTYKDTIGIPPGADANIPLTIQNVWNQNVELNVALVTQAGKKLTEGTIKLDKGASGDLKLCTALPAGTTYGSLGCALKLTSAESGVVDETLPMTIVIAEQAVKAGPFTIDGVPDKIANAVPIVLEQATDVQDLVFDPGTPNWAGKEDLSARATFAHDDKGVYLCIDVQDQSHKPGPATDKLWTADSVQVAFYTGGAHTEIGLTESDGGFGWVWASADASLVGHNLESPVSVKRTGGHTVYEAYLPYETLGVKYEPMLATRLTFLVNEDDGRGRVRIMKWFDGIATAKDADRFGHLVLE